MTALRERIEARLVLAKAATPGPWKRGPINGEIDDSHGDLVCDAAFTPDQAFIADRDPLAVATECRADLALLDEVGEEPGVGPSFGAHCVRLVHGNLEARYPV